ncbi:hypothetical protein ACSJL3_005204 (plasmid) [Serratia nevei]|uniref:hypothetical protein n=1 Tax=Serratia nevei TaxID=2703794 RepID=UPI003F6C742F
MKGQSRNEKTLVVGKLAIALRSPQNHKLGMVTQFFSHGSYPVLCSGVCPELMASLISDFEDAGYRIKIENREGGISITLDWRNAGVTDDTE